MFKTVLNSSVVVYVVECLYSWHILAKLHKIKCSGRYFGIFFFSFRSMFSIGKVCACTVQELAND